MTGTTLEQLQVVIEAETKQFRDELAKVQTQVNAATSQVERQTSKIKSAFGSIGKVIAGLGVGYGLYNLGKQAIGYASNIQEVQNVVDTAFGSMSYKCEAFAKNSIKQFGMSELSAKKTASTYMAMAKGIGMGSDSASDMAISLAGLTGDVASFFNISQDEAGTKLKSVFTGETESLKDIGVVMTQTNLKQYALKQGLSDNIEAMDQATLTTLRYKFVMDQLGLAQGDFAKTSGSWANQVRILQEQWKQLMGIVGSGLVAVFTPIIQAINAAIGKIIQFAQVVQAVFSSLFGKKGNGPGDETKKIGNSLGMAEDSAGGLNNQLDKTGEKAKKAAKQMNNLFSFDQINKLKDDSSSSDDSSGGVSIAGINSSGLGLDEEIDTSGIDKTVNTIKAKLDSIKKLIDKYKAPITASLAGILAGIGTFVAFKNLDTIGVIVGTLFKPVYTLVTTFKTLFGTLLKGEGLMSALSATFGAVNAPIILISASVAAVVGALVYLWQTSDTFKNNVIDAVNSLFGVLKNIYDSILKPLFGFLTDVFTTVLIPIATFIADVFVTAVEAVSTVTLTLWNSVLVPLANFIVDVLGMALQGIIDVWNGWKPVIDILFAAIMGIWNTVFKPLVDWIVSVFVVTFQNWGEVINQLIPSVVQIFQGLVDFFVGVFTLDLGKCWQGITEIFTGFDDFLTNVFCIDWSKNFGVFGEVMNSFFKTLKSIWDGIKTIFKGIIEFISGVFTGDWSRAWEGIKTIFSGMWGTLQGIVKDAWDGIVGLFSFGGRIFSGVVDGIATVFRNIVNCIISGINRVISYPFDRINSMLNSIKDISIPLIGKPFSGFWGYNPIWVPQIPMLAQGAVVDKATMAMVGEAGREAIVPLDRNTRGLDLLASRLIERIYPQAPVQSQGGGNLYITLMLENGKVLTNYIIEEYNKLMVSQNGVGGFVQ